MKRTEKLSTSVTPDEKREFRVEAAERDQEMAELLREILYDWMEEQEIETSREDAEGNSTLATAD